MNQKFCTKCGKKITKLFVNDRKKKKTEKRNTSSEYNGFQLINTPKGGWQNCEFGYINCVDKYKNDGKMSQKDAEAMCNKKCIKCDHCFKCKNCGTFIKNLNQKFCTKCGNKITKRFVNDRKKKKTEKSSNLSSNNNPTSNLYRKEYTECVKKLNTNKKRRSEFVKRWGKTSTSNIQNKKSLLQQYCL